MCVSYHVVGDEALNIVSSILEDLSFLMSTLLFGWACSSQVTAFVLYLFVS